MTERKALFPYPGSKWRMMPTILSLLPDHDHYVVPFGGSGTEILAKTPSKLESFNDKDELIYNLFNVIVRGKRHELRRRVEATSDRAKKFFDDARAILRQPQISNPVESAWALLVAAHHGNKTAHAALLADSQWAYMKIPVHNRWPGLPLAIDFVARRFKGVQLFNHDWQSVVERLDMPRTVFVCDPPYSPDIVRHVREYYRHTLSVPEHEQMLKTLRNVRGYVVLCGYAHPVYTDLLKDWRTIRFPTFKSLSVNGDRNKVDEVLWLNYRKDGTRIG